MAAPFTPGPWRATFGSGGYNAVVKAAAPDYDWTDDDEIACVDNPDDDRIVHLIAAAPDMLAALRVVRAFGLNAASAKAVLPMVNAAITKAEGEEEGARPAIGGAADDRQPTEPQDAA